MAGSKGDFREHGRGQEGERVGRMHNRGVGDDREQGRGQEGERA